jgi:predicted Zn-dependent protease
MKPLAPILVSISGVAAIATENPRVDFAFGVLEETRGHDGRAAEYFEQARRLDPTAAPLVRRAVDRLLEAGNRADAIRLWQELAAARPDDAAIQVDYADFLVQEGRGDALALKLASHPGNPGIIRRLCSIYQNQGDLARCRELASQLSPDDPAAVLQFADLARTLYDRDDTSARDETSRRFDLALTTQPEHAGLARAASEFHRSAGNRDKAVDALAKHIAAAPWSLDLRARLGILLFSAKRGPEGERVLLDLLAIHPRHGQAHQSLAKYYRMEGNTEAAARHAGEALKIRGGDPAEFLKLADEHLAANRPREARLLLEKAVFDHPENLDLRMKLAVASQRDPESRARASRLFREAEAAAPEGGITDPLFLTASAEALIASGQPKAAEERLRAAIRLHPPEAKAETAATLRRLASLWETENRNIEAARALRQRADALDPAGAAQEPR